MPSATARRGSTRVGWSSRYASSGCWARRTYWTGATDLRRDRSSHRHHDEVVRLLVHRHHTVSGDDDDVLDARTPLAGEVDARFDAERHALLQCEIVARHDVGLLVHR